MRGRNDLNYATNDHRDRTQERYSKGSRDFDAEKLAENARNRDAENQRHAAESARRGGHR